MVAKAKKFKITIELTAEEIQLISYGWQSRYYGGELLTFGVPYAAGEDKRVRYYKECEKQRHIINRLPTIIVNSITASKMTQIEKELAKRSQPKEKR